MALGLRLGIASRDYSRTRAWERRIDLEGSLGELRCLGKRAACRSNQRGRCRLDDPAVIEAARIISRRISRRISQ